MLLNTQDGLVVRNNIAYKQSPKGLRIAHIHHKQPLFESMPTYHRPIIHERRNSSLSDTLCLSESHSPNESEEPPREASTSPKEGYTEIESFDLSQIPNYPALNTSIQEAVSAPNSVQVTPVHRRFYPKTPNEGHRLSLTESFNDPMSLTQVDTSAVPSYLSSYVQLIPVH